MKQLSYNCKPHLPLTCMSSPGFILAAKRYIPIRPTLPNGLKDAFGPNKTNVPADPRAQGKQRLIREAPHLINLSLVETLLNPCTCKDVWSCRCRPGAGPGEGSGCHGGLAALAQAAEMCCSPIDSALSPRGRSTKGKQKDGGTECCLPAVSHSPPSKRRRQSLRATPPPHDNQRRGPALPPILSIPPPSSAFSPTIPPPSFPVIPPLGAIVSLAGTGCTCGFDCTCPGCTEHRGKQHAAHNRGDCPDECGTCVDHQHGVELPTTTPFGATSSSSSSTSFIDAFFARAAAIPPPPIQRASTIALDGSNVTVYPRSLFDGEGKNSDEVGRAFGLVQVPKLECCAGRCGCPGDSCGCGDGCGGSCSDHQDGEDVNSRQAGVSLPFTQDLAGALCCSE